MSSAPSAPASSAPRVRRIASAVELEPVPAITGTRPRAARTTWRTISTCSSCVSVADSPDEPQGTRPCVPPAICISTRSASAFESIAPLRKGVTSAVSEPVNILHLHAAVEDLDGVSGHEDAVVGAPVDLELAAGERDDDRAPGAPGARGRDADRARARPAGERLAGAALPDAHLEPRRPGDAHELRVHPAREERVALARRP